MHDKLPPGITLIKADNFQTWFVDIQVVDSNPLYQGETYRLKFNFSPQYPIEVCTVSSFLISGATASQPDNGLTHSPHSHLKSHSLATTPIQSRGTRTSTPTASYVSTCSTVKAGRRSTTLRACA
jgi:hypothetical protein